MPRNPKNPKTPLDIITWLTFGIIYSLLKARSLKYIIIIIFLSKQIHTW